MKSDFLSNLFNLKNKVVLVTGATGQLGFEICKACMKAGARVAGTDICLNKKRMVKSKNIEYLEMDICNKNSVSGVFEYIYSNRPRLDVLINNAGVSCFEPFDKRPEESFDLVMDVNLKGTFFCIREYIRRAKKMRGGNIINVASIYGVVSPDFRIYTDCKRNNSEVYGATKAGIIQMTRYFAVHAARFGIRVNSISPGGIFNPEDPQGKDFVKNYSYRCPMGRMANYDDVVGGILYFSSGAAAYVTGQNLIIDGGLSCW